MIARKRFCNEEEVKTMRHELATTKNIVRLRDAYEELHDRSTGVPGMGLVFGYTGYGKSTAIAWLVNQVNGVCVRANATWTPNAMLGQIMKELGAAPTHSGGATMVDFIVEKLALENRPLFVDEADYFFNYGAKMIETLRDIHDLSGSPVMMVGMEGIEKRLVHRKQLARRISQWVEFLPTDLQDARIVADTVCEVEIEEDLLCHLHDETQGSVGLMVVGMARIESFARSNNFKKMNMERWGNRKLFLSRAPRV